MGLAIFMELIMNKWELLADILLNKIPLCRTKHLNKALIFYLLFIYDYRIFIIEYIYINILSLVNYNIFVKIYKIIFLKKHLPVPPFIVS